MPRTNVFIPLAKGIDQKLDERLRAPESLAVLTNAFYRRNNGVTKRHGFTRLSSQPTTVGTPKGMMSTGEELLVRGYDRLHAYNDGDGWYTRGMLAPFTGSQKTLFGDSWNVGSNDVSAWGSGLILHAAAQSKGTTTAFGGIQTRIVWKMTRQDGSELNDPLVSNQLSYDAGTNYNLHAVRCVGTGTKAWLGFHKYTTTSLFWYKFDSASPAAAPILQIFHNDCFTDADPQQGQKRYYDACKFSNGAADDRWGYAYLKLNAIGGVEIYAAIYNGIVPVATWTIPSLAAGNWDNVAVAVGTNPASFYVFASNTAGNSQLYSYTTAGVAQWNTAGPSTPVGLFRGLALCDGLDSDGVTRRLVLAGNYSTAGATVPEQRNLLLATILPTGAGLSATAKVYNCYAISKPWNINNRWYIGAQTREGLGDNVVNNYDNGYDSEVIFDVMGFVRPTTNLPNPYQLGRFNTGVTPSRSKFQPGIEYDHVRGSLSQAELVYNSTSVVRYATQRITNMVPLQFPTLAGDEVELDFAGKVTQATVTRGSAVFGGGGVSYYAGSRAEELGFNCGPVIAYLKDVLDVNGTLVPGTYTYQAVYESFDEKGNLTRSVPGPPVTYTIGGGMANHRMDCVIYAPVTQRYQQGKRFQVALYRADADGVFQRCTAPWNNALDNQGTAAAMPFIQDFGAEYQVLYTQSGAELEASGPDGAALVAVGTKRVWLAGFYRRDRVQYSKQYNPTTANEYALTPEFNDAFAFLIPGGEPVTGLAEMDDKTIIFTKSSIYAIAGNGPDDGGRGSDFSGLQLVSSDSGCIEPRSVVAFPGGIFYQAASGLFMLGRDMQITFIGQAVRDYTDVYTEITSAVLVPAENQVRFTFRKADGSIIIIFDANQMAWCVWTPQFKGPGIRSYVDMVGACLHKGSYYILDSSGVVLKETDTTYFDDETGANGPYYVPMIIETSWLQAAQPMGWQRIRKIAANCISKDKHAMRMSLYQDFSSTWSQQYVWQETDITNQQTQELFVLRTQVQKCTAFKLRLEDESSTNTLTGQGYDCDGFTVELAAKDGTYKPGTQQRN